MAARKRSDPRPRKKGSTPPADDRGCPDSEGSKYLVIPREDDEEPFLCLDALFVGENDGLISGTHDRAFKALADVVAEWAQFHAGERTTSFHGSVEQNFMLKLLTVARNLYWLEGYRFARYEFVGELEGLSEHMPWDALFEHQKARERRAKARESKKKAKKTAVKKVAKKKARKRKAA
jgi:hypothetical protein